MRLLRTSLFITLTLLSSHVLADVAEFPKVKHNYQVRGEIVEYRQYANFAFGIRVMLLASARSS
jgi:hypothetical protein